MTCAGTRSKNVLPMKVAIAAVFLAFWTGLFSHHGRISPAVKANVTAFSADTELKGRLVDPVNIDLMWSSRTTNAGPYLGGYLVEYTGDPRYEFIIIDAVAPGVSWARHPNLAPETHFIYRIRPFFGKASAVASVRTGKAPDDASQGKRMPDAAPRPDAKGKSLKDPATIDDAGPANFVAKLESPRVVDFVWKDRAGDEDGFFLEAGDKPDGDFKVVSYLDPNTTSFQIPLLPEEKKIYFRVRAFVYGKPSNLVTLDTGRDPKAPAR
jgi:hypothetical protein